MKIAAVLLILLLSAPLASAQTIQANQLQQSPTGSQLQNTQSTTSGNPQSGVLSPSVIDPSVADPSMTDPSARGIPLNEQPQTNNADGNSRSGTIIDLTSDSTAPTSSLNKADLVELISNVTGSGILFDENNSQAPPPSALTGLVPLPEPLDRTTKIVLTGKDIHENEAIEQGLSAGQFITTSSEVQNEADLQLLIAHTANEDAALEEVAINYGKIRIDYRQPAKLFGLFTTTLLQSTEVTHDGRITVKFPWYSVFYSTLDSVKTDSIKKAINESAQRTTIDLQYSLQSMAHAFQTISSIVKTGHNTTK